MLSVRLNEHQYSRNGHNSTLNDIENSRLSSRNDSESNQGTKTMKSSHSSVDYGHMSGSDVPGKFSSALNRIKYSYDYKPLMRTITRRFDSPIKVHISYILNCTQPIIFLTNFFCRVLRKRQQLHHLHHQVLPRPQKTRKRHRLSVTSHKMSYRVWRTNTQTFSIGLLNAKRSNGNKTMTIAIRHSSRRMSLVGERRIHS